MNEAIENYWREFCAAAGVDPATPFQHWFFGNRPEQASELADLVVFGPKRATASLTEYNARHPEVAPVDGGYSVVTDFHGAPRCVIRTTEVRNIPFAEVDAEFAWDEGEGDRTLEDWRAGHRAYFERDAPLHGIEFNDRTMICCERFELLYPIGEEPR